MINILTRNSKANHYQNFFQERKENILETSEGIKSIINTKIPPKTNILIVSV